MSSDLQPFAQLRTGQNCSSADLRLEAGDQPVGVLVLQGRDLEEPVMQHGPFVGCTSADIRKAFQDYQTTGFGGWPWPDVGVVHAREEQRFALFPDGTKETRPRRATK